MPYFYFNNGRSYIFVIIVSKTYLEQLSKPVNKKVNQSINQSINLYTNRLFYQKSKIQAHNRTCMSVSLVMSQCIKWTRSPAIVAPFSSTNMTETSERDLPPLSPLSHLQTWQKQVNAISRHCRLFLICKHDRNKTEWNQRKYIHVLNIYDHVFNFCIRFY